MPEESLLMQYARAYGTLASTVTMLLWTLEHDTQHRLDHDVPSRYLAADIAAVRQALLLDPQPSTVSA